MDSSKIILPGDPEFNFTLGTFIPFGWQNEIKSDEFAFVMSTDGLLRVAKNHQEINEYVYGGEWDEVVNVDQN